MEHKKNIIFVTGGALIASTAYAPLVSAQTVEATSTVEQTQSNLGVGFALFIAGFVVFVWLTQDKRARL